MVALVTHFFSPETLDLWGWRLPFVFGLLIGPVGLWIRRHMEDPEEFIEARKQATGPAPSLMTVLREHRRSILVSMGLACGATVSFYVVLVNMPTFAHKNLGLPLDQVLMVQMFAVALMTVVIPLSGLLSDRLGRRPVLMAFTLAFFVMVYPLYVWVAAAPSIERLLVMQVMLCIAIGGFFGPAPTALAEQFPIEVRSTGVSVAYNVAVMLFGGFAPLIVTWLSKVLETPVAPAFYVLFACVLTLLGTYCMHEAPRAAAPARFAKGVKP